MEPLSTSEFEEIVAEAFAALPPAIGSRMDNVSVVIMDEPDEEMTARMKIRCNSLLLGLYEGTPLVNRGTFYGSGGVIPDRIYLFKSNIEKAIRSRSEIRTKVREVLLHEIGHHFGLNEASLRAAGY